MVATKTKQNYKELSALLDADSFFYGLIDDKGLDEISRDSLYDLTQSSFQVRKAKVGIRSEAFVHVPKAEFQETRKKSYLKNIPAFRKLQNPTIFTDKVNKDIMTIWAIEKEDASKISELKQKPSLFHYSTAMIKLALSTKQDGVFANFKEETLDTVSIQNGKLLGYNRNSYYSISDVLYFTLLAFDNSDMNTNDHRLILMGDIAEGDSMHNAVIDYVKNISFIKSSIPFPNGTNQSYHQIAPIHAVSLCV